MRGVKATSILLLWCVLYCPLQFFAQEASPVNATSADIPSTSNTAEPESDFRVEKIAVAGGAEIVTVLARQRAAENIQGPISDLPMISVLRDTLGDDVPENDRLRYVWLHSYTGSTFTQKISAVVPFLYSRTTNKNEVGSDPPPAVIDLQKSDKRIWKKLFWVLFKKLVLGEFGLAATAPTFQYRQNARDRQRVAVASAMTVLSLYQNIEGESLFSETELKDMQAKLALTDKTFGWHMQSENLGRVYDKELVKIRDYRGHNWELLRQMAERQGLFFEPLVMPDGSSRHALLWVSTDDIAANKGKKFDGRFLNISNPWRDDRLRAWKGYSQERWFDGQDRETSETEPGVKKRTLIPLALYGLDHPKIPVILIDFRSSNNPKLREISKRVLSDVTGNIVNVTAFKGLAFKLGRYVYEFVSGRRGIDLNQASRLRSYAQLKVLLSLNESLDPELRDELTTRIESVSLNPLENDSDAQESIARKQYQNLLDYARDPDGLPAKIRNDRREEMTRLRHGPLAKAGFTLGHFLSLGRYTHRENDTPEMVAKMDTRRQLEFFERVIRETSVASSRPEIDSDIEKLSRALAFVSQNGAAAGEKTTRSIAKIFAITADDDLRSLCLAGLYRINNSAAKRELLAIYRNENMPTRWRDICAKYLKLALEEGQRISKRDAELIAVIASSN
ncbi:MAG: hypothetical protein ACKVQW_00155 [Pyrinomonadaceae bacterium]